jgi:hypothetical protein
MTTVRLPVRMRVGDAPEATLGIITVDTAEARGPVLAACLRNIADAYEEAHRKALADIAGQPCSATFAGPGGTVQCTLQHPHPADDEDEYPHYHRGPEDEDGVWLRWPDGAEGASAHRAREVADGEPSST